MSSESCAFIQGVIQESLDVKPDSVLFHEGSPCPEFCENTWVVGGVNVSKLLQKGALNLLD